MSRQDDEDFKVKILKFEPDGSLIVGEDITASSYATTTPKAAPSVKHDELKTEFHLLPLGALDEIAKVFQFGAQKYGDRNWESPGFLWHRPFNACLRHLFAWWRGQDKDPETGLSHLAHAACNLLFLLEYERTHPENDNRSKK